MSFFSNRKNILIIVLVLVLSVISIMVYAVPKSGTGFLTNAVNSMIMPIEKGLSTCTNGVRGFFSFISSAKHYQKENEKLVAQINQYKMEDRSEKEYRTENDRLKKLLNLKEQISAYDTVGAGVISRESSNWYTVFTIDKGTSDGIKVNDVVMASEGLVGHVKQVGLNWAKVVSIIDETSSVGGYVDRINEVAICEGDVQYAKEGKCKLTHIAVGSQLSVGDIIKTSGLSDIYPRDLLIGTVEKIYTDASTSSKYALINPAVDFSNVQEVLVLHTSTENGGQ